MEENDGSAHFLSYLSSKQTHLPVILNCLMSGNATIAKVIMERHEMLFRQTVRCQSICSICTWIKTNIFHHHEQFCVLFNTTTKATKG